jgi:tetratricopeptide (TPR) repeat protein
MARMQGMRGAILLLAVLTWGSLGPLPYAQQPEEKASREPAEEGKPYYPPPASKSVDIGNFYLKKKNLKAALSRFEEAAKTDPHYAPAYLGLGRVYEGIGLNRKALEAYQRYLDELPSAKDALEAKDVQKAVARLQKALHQGAPSGGKTPPSATPPQS